MQDISTELLNYKKDQSLTKYFLQCTKRPLVVSRTEIHRRDFGKTQLSFFELHSGVVPWGAPFLSDHRTKLFCTDHIFEFWIKCAILKLWPRAQIPKALQFAMACYLRKQLTVLSIIGLDKALSKCS